MSRSRSVCHGSGGSASPSSSAISDFTAAPDEPSEASVPAAPPNWTASRVSRTDASPSRAPSSPASQPAVTRPKVTGTACCSSVRPIISDPRCASASRATTAAAPESASAAASMASRASTIAAVSMMSWLVAPRCTAALAAGSGTSRVSARASPGTGLPVSSDDRLSSARSKSPGRAAAAVTAAPAPGGASPARSSARASADSAASMARSQAPSSATGPPRMNTPPKIPTSGTSLPSLRCRSAVLIRRLWMLSSDHDRAPRWRP